MLIKLLIGFAWEKLKKLMQRMVKNKIFVKEWENWVENGNKLIGWYWKILNELNGNKLCNLLVLLKKHHLF